MLESEDGRYVDIGDLQVFMSDIWTAMNRGEYQWTDDTMRFYGQDWYKLEEAVKALDVKP